MDQSTMSHFWMKFNSNWIGGGLSVLAAVFTNLGIVLQKRSHDNRQRKSPRSKKLSALNVGSSTWRFGMFLQAVGGLLDFEALTYASQGLIAILGGSSTVLIGALCSFYVQNETPSASDLLGFTMLLGAVFCAAEGSPPEHADYTLLRLSENFERTIFVEYLIAAVFLVCVLLICSSIWQSQAGVMYAVVSGIMGSFGVLCAKCLGEMLQQAYTGNEAVFMHFETYFFLFGAIGFLVVQIVLLNSALMCGETISVLPSFQLSWIIFSFASGVAFYHETLSEGDKALLTVSLALSAIGIVFLARRVGASSKALEEMRRRERQSIRRGERMLAPRFSPLVSSMPALQTPSITSTYARVIATPGEMVTHGMQPSHMDIVEQPPQLTVSTAAESYRNGYGSLIQSVRPSEEIDNI